jgi:hypothetical protein
VQGCQSICQSITRSEENDGAPGLSFENPL